MDIGTVLQALYDSEINARVFSFWDAGWTAELGDDMNGILESEDGLTDLKAVAEWLHNAALRHFPNSVYAKRAARGSGAGRADEVFG